MKGAIAVPGRLIKSLQLSTAEPCSKTTTPTAQAELSSLVAVSKSIAANDLPASQADQSVGSIIVLRGNLSSFIRRSELATILTDLTETPLNPAFGNVALWK